MLPSMLHLSSLLMVPLGRNASYNFCHLVTIIVLHIIDAPKLLINWTFLINVADSEMEFSWRDSEESAYCL